ncbi:hypothetical protein POF51_26095 [Brevibacillus sp. AG]|uniref:hypothetical protein n=1 Tax=Brevibacillus sp. AG TaxID=3020891 RepID=UPI00232B7567|nr:hypothetical protein [Brevibacillus sp. AG]MDC0764195.1 hypothetical protein [Brevibacillus sp. AG]
MDFIQSILYQFGTANYFILSLIAFCFLPVVFIEVRKKLRLRRLYRKFEVLSDLHPNRMYVEQAVQTGIFTVELDNEQIQYRFEGLKPYRIEAM